jgi:PAS domain S-box-containing protein
MLSMAINITERKKAEDALKRSEDKYRTLVENSLQGLAIIQDLRIVYCNHTFADILGYSIEELLSMNPRQVLGLVALNDRELLLRRNRERMEGKVVPSRYEHKAVKRDGTVIWVEALISLTEYLGKPAVQATYIDISSRKEAEQRIKASKDHLDAILNHISDPIFVLDRQHRILLINDAGCAFSGMRREDLIGTATHQYLSKERAEEMWRQEEDVFNTGKECVTEEFLSDARGNMHALIVKKSMLIDRYGNKELIGVARDITEYKNLQAQMLQVQKMEAMGVLANGIAADFNNLLSIIKGYVELVIEERAADTELCQDLEKAMQACQRGETLTKQLVAFSQTHKLNMEILDLNEIIREMKSLIQRLIGEAVSYEAILDPDLAFIHSDPDQVRQIITNLVVNAQAAMPEGGKLTIQTANVQLDESQARKHPEAKAGCYVLLTIADNGIGMDDHVKAHLFEPFFTTKGEGKGTGLGLSTVYGIVKQSKGFIAVESEPEKGTKFLLYFPCER